MALGFNDESQALECLGKCTESLVSTAPQKDAVGSLAASSFQKDSNNKLQQTNFGQDHSLVAFQESQSRIELRAFDLLDLEDALGQVAYVNKRLLPSVGQRVLSVDTQLHCSAANQLLQQQQSAIVVEQARVAIDVLPSGQLPVLHISGAWRNLAREYGPFQSGVALFESISLQVKRLRLGPAALQLESNKQLATQPNGQSDNNHLLLDYVDDASQGAESTAGADSAASRPVDNPSSLARHRVEACSVRVEGAPLEQTHERLILPTDQLDALNLYWRASASGLVVYGLDSVENYERLIRKLIYQNDRPQLYGERSFKLHCSDMSGRLLSNELLQTLTVIHLKPSQSSSWNNNNNNQQAVAGEPRVFKGNLVGQSGQQQVHLQLLGSSATAPPAAALRGSALPVVNMTLELEAHERQPGGLVAQKLHANEHLLQWMRPGDFEQASPDISARLNRVAVAFLVFVVSLIIIMLIVALANLRESAQTGCSQVGDEDEEGEDEEEDEEEDCDEEQEQEDDDLDCNESGRFAGAPSRTQERHNRKTLRWRAQEQRASSDLLPFEQGFASSDDEEDILMELGRRRSLQMRDFEQRAMGVEAATTIVMNPILHGQQRNKQRRNHTFGLDNQVGAAHNRQQTLMVAELEPGKKAAVNCRPLHLPSSWAKRKWHSDQLIVSSKRQQRRRSNAGRNASHQGEEEVANSLAIVEDVQADELLLTTRSRSSSVSSSSSSSSSSSLSSDSSGSTSSTTSTSSGSSRPDWPQFDDGSCLEDEERRQAGGRANLIRGGLCQEHRRHKHHHHAHSHHHHHDHSNQLSHEGVDEEEEEEESGHGGQHYELYHRHHVHHACLQQQQQQPDAVESQKEEEEAVVSCNMGGLRQRRERFGLDWAD